MTQRDDTFTIASELNQQKVRKSTYKRTVQRYFYAQGEEPPSEKDAVAESVARAHKIRETYDASVRKFEVDLESIRIFVYTIKEHCLRFCSYHSQLSKEANLDFLTEHEEERRQEFVDKFEALIEQRFKDRLLQKMEKGEETLSDYSDDEHEAGLALQVFLCCMDDCLELCSEYIALFENKTFWSDIVGNHRQTIWKRKREELKEQIQKRPMTADPLRLGAGGHRLQQSSSSLVPRLRVGEVQANATEGMITFGRGGPSPASTLDIGELMDMTLGLDKLSTGTSSKANSQNVPA